MFFEGMEPGDGRTLLAEAADLREAFREESLAFRERWRQACLEVRDRVPVRHHRRPRPRRCCGRSSAGGAGRGGELSDGIPRPLHPAGPAGRRPALADPPDRQAPGDAGALRGHAAAAAVGAAGVGPAAAARDPAADRPHRRGGGAAADLRPPVRRAAERPARGEPGRPERGHRPRRLGQHAPPGRRQHHVRPGPGPGAHAAAPAARRRRRGAADWRRRGASPGWASCRWNAARLLEALESTRSTARAADFTQALRRAAAILATSQRQERRIFVVTDLQAAGWGDGPPARAAAPTWCCWTSPRPRPGPTGRWSRSTPSRRPIWAPGTVVGRGGDRRLLGQGQHRAGGDAEDRRRRGQQELHRSAGQRPPEEDASSTPCPRAAARTTSRSSIDGDDFPLDDRRLGRLELSHALRVLVINGDARTVSREDEAYFLETGAQGQRPQHLGDDRAARRRRPRGAVQLQRRVPGQRGRPQRGPGHAPSPASSTPAAGCSCRWAARWTPPSGTNAWRRCCRSRCR